MSIGYTSLLALVQPVDGTEVGTWGDDVNNGVSSILDVAVAGTQNITTDANVTLTITQATSSGTNLSSTSAQYAILLLSGARTATRTVTLPASSKTYTVMNSTTGGFAQTVGGLTIAVGEYCTIAYNTSSSTWVKTSTQSGSGVFTTVTATVAYQGDFSNSTLLSRTLFTTTTANSTTGIYAVPSGTATAASWQATNAADPTNASKILIATNGSTDVQLVSGRNGTGTYLPLSFYTNGSQQAQLTVAGVWTTVNDASIHGLTVGQGAGSVSTNTVVGNGALSGSNTGGSNSAFGQNSLQSNTSGINNVALGTALLNNTSGSYNTAVGYIASYANTTGSYNTAVGEEALRLNTTASNNTAVGYQAGYSNTTGSTISIFGYHAGYSNTTGSLEAFGYYAGNGNTTGTGNVAMGNGALQTNSTGSNNTALGANALILSTTASNNTAVGYQAGYSNTTGSSNTAVGYQAGFSSTGSGNTALGQGVSVGTSGNNNTCLGIGSGISLTSGSGNVFVGSVGSGSTGGAGYFVTTGSNNTILGGYTGNNGGLDIRTASNYIVLSDGAGNPRANWTSTGNMVSGAATPIISGNNSFQLGHASNYIFEMGNTANTGLEGCLTTLLTSANNATTSYHYASYCSSSSSLAYSTMVFGVLGNGNVKNANNSYGAISDIKVKQNISLSGSQWNDVKALGALVKKFSLISDPTNTMQIGWVAQDVQTVSPGLVYSTPDRDENHELTGTSTLGVNYSIAYMKAFKALSEAQVRIETLESTIAQMQAALKAAGIAGF